MVQTKKGAGPAVFLVTIIFTSFFLAAGQAHARNLDFENLAHSGFFTPVGRSYNEDGFTLTASGGIKFLAVGTSAQQYLGSAALIESDSATINLFNSSGFLFDLLSIDLSEYNQGHTDVVYVFEGTKPDSSTVLTSFFLDGGPIGFNTFTFPSDFSNLVSVSWTISGDTSHYFDNINVNPASFPVFVGVFRDSVWYLDLDGNGAWDGTSDDLFYPNFVAGLSGAVPVTGDWDGTGETKIGVFRDGVWYLDMDGNGAWNPANDTFTYFGLPGDIPVTGDWDDTGTTTVGVFRDGVWYLDMDGSGAWNPANDTFTYFALPGDTPVTGRW